MAEAHPETLAHGRLGLVVVAYNSQDLLLKHLAPMSLRDQDVVVVVDNSPDPGIREATAQIARDHGWRYLAFPSNPGFGFSCNAGAALAIEVEECVTVLFINPDASLSKESLEHLRTTVRPGELVAPQMVDSSGSPWFDGGGFSKAKGFAEHVSSNVRLEWLTGACIICTAESWTELGGFDESYFLYWEDVDLSRQWLARGGSLRVDSRATAHHDVGGTQGVAAFRRSDHYYYFNARNRMLFARKWLRPVVVAWWIFVSPLYIASLLRRDVKFGARRQMKLVVIGVRGTLRGVSMRRAVGGEKSE